MRRRRFLAAAGASATLAVSGCAGVFSADDFDVGMSASSFSPGELTVSVGDEVVWENTSSRAHTVTAYENAIPEEASYFASGGYESESAAREAWAQDLGGRIDNGERFSHTFEVSGRYDYVCIPHETGGMVGAIIVEE